jgi:hypothetical protein
MTGDTIGFCLQGGHVNRPLRLVGEVLDMFEEIALTSRKFTEFSPQINAHLPED